MIKIVIASLILICLPQFCQNINNKADLINIYCDSIDNLIINSSGFEGDLFCNTISTKRMVRAIGLQETKINFYFIPKEDSVLDFGDSVQFIPQYNPPLKIKSEYNIAASQSVAVNYYFDETGAIIFYHYLSTGAYGMEENCMWFENRTLVQLEYFNENGGGRIVKKNTKFTKDERDDEKDIIENADEYLEVYYNLFNTEQIDK